MFEALKKIQGTIIRYCLFLPFPHMHPIPINVLTIFCISVPV